MIAFLVVIGDCCYVTSNDQKLPAITLLEGMFPELSTNHLKSAFFTQWVFLTTPLLRTAAFSRNGTNLPEAKPEEFKSEGYDALRSAVLMRTFVFMIRIQLKKTKKCEQVSPLKGTLYGNCILHFTGDPKLININTKTSYFNKANHFRRCPSYLYLAMPDIWRPYSELTC